MSLNRVDAPEPLRNLLDQPVAVPSKVLCRDLRESRYRLVDVYDPLRQTSPSCSSMKPGGTDGNLLYWRAYRTTPSAIPSARV